MTRVIVVASGKGGVGKTTIAANLAVALSLFGKKVAVVDADIVMANLEIIMGLKNPPVALIDVLKGRLEVEDVIYEGPEGVKIIPAGITLDGFNEENMETLKTLLKEIPAYIEILVIDAPAGRDATMVMDRGQEVIIVTVPQVSSVSDALKMKILAERMGAEVTGAVINMARGRKYELTAEEIENTLDTSVIAVLPDDEAVKEALAYEMLYVLKYPRARVTRETLSLAANLIGVTYNPEGRGFLHRLHRFFTH
ncbi:septum site-determining protein MinD [archaeon]|nr:septum site-determining protein MinD [archaeon]